MEYALLGILIELAIALNIIFAILAYKIVNKYIE